MFKQSRSPGEIATLHDAHAKLTDYVAAIRAVSKPSFEDYIRIADIDQAMIPRHLGSLVLGLGKQPRNDPSQAHIRDRHIRRGNTFKAEVQNTERGRVIALSHSHGSLLLPTSDVKTVRFPELHPRETVVTHLESALNMYVDSSTLRSYTYPQAPEKNNRPVSHFPLATMTLMAPRTLSHEPLPFEKFVAISTDLIDQFLAMTEKNL